MYDRLFAQSDVVGLALNAYILRNEVINHNISNVDTPGFKKSAVDFEKAFKEAIEDSAKTGRLDMSKTGPIVRLIYENYSYRLDGNNVDIEIEMADLYKNSVKYDVLSNSVINNYRKINLVVTGR